MILDIQKEREEEKTEKFETYDQIMTRLNLAEHQMECAKILLKTSQKEQALRYVRAAAILLNTQD